MAEPRPPIARTSAQAGEAATPLGNIILFFVPSFIACWTINGIIAYTTSSTPLHSDDGIIALLLVLWTLEAMLVVFFIVVLAPRFPAVNGIHCYCAALAGGLSIALYGTLWQSLGNVASWGMWMSATCVLSIALEARYGAFRMVNRRLDSWLAGMERT